MWSVLRFSNYMLSKSSVSCNDLMIIWPLMLLSHSSWHFLWSLQTVEWLGSVKYHCWPCDVVGSLNAPLVFFSPVSLNREWRTHFPGHCWANSQLLTLGREGPCRWEGSARYAKARSWVTTQCPASSFRGRVPPHRGRWGSGGSDGWVSLGCSASALLFLRFRTQPGSRIVSFQGSGHWRALRGALVSTLCLGVQKAQFKLCHA